PAEGGVRVGVANLLGRHFMEPLDDPFRLADTILESFRGQTAISFFDFHAEATSEKAAFGHYLDGRASAVVGTHTHVQTADERLLPGGTAYITDVGMCGPQHSVIGMCVETVVRKFITQRPHRLEVAAGPVVLCGVVVDVDPQTGHATHIERVQIRDVY
ncbi:MAG: YmdB family metallophosphoesterase, partial [Armatimonadetes bacterium]|nr:YmdB family metallophosphoesterase [Armatimonadota bacterium]